MTDSRCAFASFPPLPRSMPPPGTPAPIRRWRRLLNQILSCRPSRIYHSNIPYNPFISYDFLHALEASGSATARAGWQPQHVLAEDAGRRRPRRGALLSEIALARRIRLRPRLGRGLRARRRRSTTPSSRCRCRSRRRPAGGSWSRPSPGADKVRDGLIAGLIELCRRHEASSVHFTFLPEPECQALVGPRLPAPHRPAVPLGEPRLRDLRRVPGGALGAQAQDHPARAARRARPRHHRALAHRQGPDRRGLGRLLRVLHGDRLAQMGPALPHPQVLLADRPEHGRQDRADDGQARRPLSSPAPSTSSAATRCSAATGAPSSTTRSCISSSATTRPSTSPSTASSSASRPAPRASTSSPAATCR